MITYSKSLELRRSREHRRQPEHIFDIEQKEDVYSLGVLIMDILMGYYAAHDYIQTLFMRQGSLFELVVPDELHEDPGNACGCGWYIVIYNIVKDCIKDVEHRPTIEEIYDRLSRW